LWPKTSAQAAERASVRPVCRANAGQADVNAELETGFDDIEQKLRTMAGQQLRGIEQSWGFQRRQGLIAEELIAAAKDIRVARPQATVGIVVGSSSLGAHRVVGSVAVSLARHSPVSLVVVP
jgi:nucleotide-binding universal stress UspA family protein